MKKLLYTWITMDNILKCIVESQTSTTARKIKEIYMNLLAGRSHESIELTGVQMFQKDGVLSHTAPAVKDWTSACEIHVINDWHDEFPHISPIENIWIIIKMDLQKKTPAFCLVWRRPFDSRGPKYLNEILT